MVASFLPFNKAAMGTKTLLDVNNRVNNLLVPASLSKKLQRWLPTTCERRSFVACPTLPVKDRYNQPMEGSSLPCWRKFAKHRPSTFRPLSSSCLRSASSQQTLLLQQSHPYIQYADLQKDASCAQEVHRHALQWPIRQITNSNSSMLISTSIFLNCRDRRSWLSWREERGVDATWGFFLYGVASGWKPIVKIMILTPGDFWETFWDHYYL